LTISYLISTHKWLYLRSPQHYPSSFFFFNDTPPTEIYTLSLHDALPIYQPDDVESVRRHRVAHVGHVHARQRSDPADRDGHGIRSEEHTSELQSQSNLVCRLLLEKKKKNVTTPNMNVTDQTQFIIYLNIT